VPIAQRVELLRHTAVGVFQQYPPSSAALSLSSEFLREMFHFLELSKVKSDSLCTGVELSPTGTDCREARERHPTAWFELLRQSRPDRRGGSCRGPNGHFRPVWTNGQCWRRIYKDLRWLATRPPGHQATRPLTASHGQFFCRNWPIATHWAGFAPGTPSASMARAERRIPLIGILTLLGVLQYAPRSSVNANLLRGASTFDVE
jgi:hypothetical protein